MKVVFVKELPPRLTKLEELREHLRPEDSIRIHEDFSCLEISLVVSFVVFLHLASHFSSNGEVIIY